MANELRKLKRKRQYESGGEQKAKQRKTRAIKKLVNVPDAEAFTNICFELIERIFCSLDPQSLLNMADTCKRLQIAAVSKYKQKFGKYYTKLYLNGYCERTGVRFEKDLNKGVRFERDVVHVYGPTILPFLRCFGAQISRLEVFGAVNKHVVRYINQYCADNLNAIRIYDMDEGNYSTENFRKPFKLVEVVEITKLGKQFSNFGYWFPNMRSLSFSTKSFDFGVTSPVFPHLEKLEVIGRPYSHADNKQIQRLIIQNQQLQWLDIRMPTLQFSKLLDMISGHTMISKLLVYTYMSGNRNVERAQLLRFAREHRLMVDLNLMAYLFKADDAVALICELNSLKSFQFQLKDLTECRYLVDQLRQHGNSFKFKGELLRIYLPKTAVRLKFDRLPI